MEGGCPNLLDLMIPKEKEDKDLELRLAPPGEEEEEEETNNGGISIGYFRKQIYHHQQQVINEVDLKQTAVIKAAAPTSSHERNAPGPVVGWPPIRSFRKNLASSSFSKPPTALETQNRNPNKKATSDKQQSLEPCKSSKLVKINMDGVPIGRKVDLNAYDSYEKLSIAVDELFRGLLAAQGNSSPLDEEKAITGVLGGSGEFTLIYEDNEGDKMLVGDVPWNMFVFAVRRLRAIKSSEVSALNFGSSKQEETLLR